MKQNSDAWTPVLLTSILGLAVGTVDFVSPDFRQAMLLIALGGGLIGYLFPQRLWSLALWLGLLVPIAIIMGMASGHHPARGHFVLIDVRAVIPALFGAVIGGWLGGKRQSGDRNAEKTI
jgi:hypothetical protein